MAAVGWDGRDVSGLSHEQIHRWTREGASPEALAAARDRHLARADELRTAADRLRGAQRGVAEGWIGRDADAAGQRTGTLASRMEQLAETVSGQARGVDGLRAALLRVQAVVGPPRPPALPPLGAPPVLGELRALVTGAPADGFGGFRAAAEEQAAAREAYRTYLTETAAAARGVAQAGAGPPPPTAASPGPAPAGAGPAVQAAGRPVPLAGAATSGTSGMPGPSGAAGGDAAVGTARGTAPAPGVRGAPTGVLQRAAAAMTAPAPPGDLPVGPRAVDAGPVPGVTATARGAGPVLEHGPATPSPAVGPTTSSPATPGGAAPGGVAQGGATQSGAAASAGPVDPGRAPGAPLTPVSGDGGSGRPVPFAAPGSAGRSSTGRRREARPGGPGQPGPGQTGPGHAGPGPSGLGHTEHGDPAAASANGPAGTAPAGSDPGQTTAPPDGHPSRPDAGAQPVPGPLDAAPLGIAPATGGPDEHRLPPRRTEYLVDPDPAGWGADAARRVAPPVLGEDDDEAGS